MALQETFDHEPLESPERQIRLLEVKASDHGTTEYHLTTHILGAANMPHFYALSYEWGTDLPSHTLLIDGKIFKIRQNLKLFLDRIYSETQDFIRPLWVDAICIDQQRTSERNEQVKIMGRIFSAATLVLTWLGPQTVENGALAEIEVTLRGWKESKEYTDLRAGRPVQSPKIVSLQDPYGPMWNCLLLLCELTYWKRRWSKSFPWSNENNILRHDTLVALCGTVADCLGLVIQELIKAGKLLFLWGNEQISWEALSVAFSAIHETRRNRRQSAPMTGPWDAIASSTPFSVWQHVQGLHDQHRLLQTMETYQYSQCSVYHDKAYALTGISADSDKVQVDYDKSLPDLYADLMALEPKTPKCLKYSKLILDALCIDKRTWENGPVTGRTVVCKGEKIGPVIASISIPSPVTNSLIDTDMWQMFANARPSGLSEIPDAIRWAQQANAEISKHMTDAYTVSFFLLLGGSIGMTLAPVDAGDIIYMVNAALEESTPIYLCQSQLAGRSGSVSSLRSSVVSIGRSNPQVSRAWLSTAPGANSTGQLEMSDTIEITLGDLYDMNDILTWDIFVDTPLPSPTEAPSSPRPSLRRPYSDTTEIRPHRASTVSASIDGAMHYRLRNTYTWPAGSTNTDGWYIDALAREMQAKLFLGSSKLNSPE